MKVVLPGLIVVLLICLATLLLTHDKIPEVTIHLAGDSTMAMQRDDNRPMTGWGEAFTSLLCDDIRVINHARNGRSTKSFLAEGRWEDLLLQLHENDLVMIQFGHNDQKINNPALFTSPGKEYEKNLQRFVSDVRKRGADPVLLTSIVRRAFTPQGSLDNTLGDYPASTRAVARTMAVDVIDLNKATKALVEAEGPDASKALYLHLTSVAHQNYPEGAQDDTHLSPQGALQVARLVADELQKTRSGLICS